MKIAVLLILLFLHGDLLAQSIDLYAIRKDFNKGVKDEALCTRYHNMLTDQAKTPVEKGYRAAFHMFMATHTANPIKKMSYFRQGKNMLEDVIKSNPQDTELRFIRLCIQYHTPRYLGYRGEIDEDKQYMLDNLYKMDDARTKRLIYDYLKGANMYDEQELEQLGR